MIDSEARIGVIGAGASGLAAADALRRAGYGSVTVLEKSERVGGKCCTFFHDGRSYELGAAAITSAYVDVHALMGECGVRSSAGIGGVFVDLETGHRRSTYVPAALRGSPLAAARLGREGVRYAAALWRERRILRPGFAGISPELCAPFSSWARARGLEGVASLIEPWFTGFGYGRFDEVPAAYVLKYSGLFRFPLGELLVTGYQGLWERVAARLDVRLGVRIERIRRGAEVVVETDRETFAFDFLVVACPPEDALGILDAADEERELFSRVVYENYHVVAASVEGAPGSARYGFVPRHLRRDRAGRVAFWYRRWMESDVVVYYCLPPAGTKPDETIETVRRDVVQMGGKVTHVHRKQAWRYFPHIASDDMRLGYYDRLEAMQGRRRTYFVGELFAFATVQNVVAYARALVARCFGA